MPPRYSYWTIIAGGLPTAFRSAEKEELLPTFARIKHKHPDAEMKWFARGKLWDSPESARAANRRTEQPAFSRPPAAPRGRDWRPGGEHRDPRQKYRDAKTARNVEQRKRKFQRKQRSDQPGEPRFDRRPFEPRFDKRSGPRNQDTREPRRPAPSKTDRPNREPRRREGHEPSPPPKPSEPVTAPPGPPERGRGRDRNRRRNR